MMENTNELQENSKLNIPFQVLSFRNVLYMFQLSKMDLFCQHQNQLSLTFSIHNQLPIPMITQSVEIFKVSCFILKSTHRSIRYINISVVNHFFFEKRINSSFIIIKDPMITSSNSSSASDSIKNVCQNLDHMKESLNRLRRLGGK